ncbi:BREX system ATP-binding domain-containing protein [Leifsonia sp. TF02-11]|uniref:BREX system ATP-binding domain-containing protein n=1 Tax=Leifsonia sp. TF02-11 TaxID=2815212 RepID=UPI001AA144E2|nr:LuxR family transcriptional regulator [Leifsonia sp. TF02-11]MBO1741452.1 DUF2791 family P-loop domain-containing protein [Leifsonia sp. TF02-11]
MPTWPVQADRSIATLVGRERESVRLDRLLDEVRGGASRILILSGEAGSGKTALLDRLVRAADDFQVVSTVGVQAERELPFAALQQLCTPLLAHLGALPARQASALRVTFCVEDGPAPDRLLVSLALLGLFAEAAVDRPLLCVVDDEQWIDAASAEALTFAARRLGEESVALVFATRSPGDRLDGLPVESVRPLDDADADRLLSSTLPFAVDRRVRDQLVADAHGNPLALVELSRELRMARLGGGYGLADALPLPASLDAVFRRRIEALSPESRRLLVLAAADATGNIRLLWDAAALLGIPTDAARQLVDQGCLEFGLRVRLQHPLLRSAAYRTATSQELADVHAALAAATDPVADPDRRAWHRAEAATGLDDDTARELESSAERARARGGLAAAAAFLQRATLLSPAGADRTRRALAAARATVQVGAFDDARALLDLAETGSAGPADLARAQQLRAEVEFAGDRNGRVPALLLAAAEAIRPWDPELARSSLLDALRSSVYAGRFAEEGSDLATVARVAASAPSPGPSRATEPLDRIVGRYETNGDPVPAFVSALRNIGCPNDDHASDPRWLSLLAFAASGAWDFPFWDALTGRFVLECREQGALSELRLALTQRIYVLLLAGRAREAEEAIDELTAALGTMGGRMASYSALAVAAFVGRERDVLEVADAAIRDAHARGEGLVLTGARWAVCVLYNGLGHYAEALDHARGALEPPVDELGLDNWTLVELIEAASRTGERDAAERAFARLTRTTRQSDGGWARGIQERCAALLADDAEAETHYREAIRLLGHSGLDAEEARAHLLYGEWLRRQRRRSGARTQLRLAHQRFEAVGMAAFAERARRELWATGEVVRSEAPTTGPALTAQEEQIAQLATDGLSNPEIGVRLFISARTVEYHLGKVFAKLNISSRAQLADARRAPAGRAARPVE